VNGNTVVRFADSIDTRVAEQTIDRFSAETTSGRPVLLDFSQTRRVDLGAGYRIGNVLRILHESSPIATLLPPNSVAGQNVSGDFFLAFTRSGLGPALAKYCTEISSDGGDVTHTLRQYYSKTLSVPAQNAVYLPDIHTGVVDIDDEAGFGRSLGELLQGVNVRVAAIERVALADVIGFCFEAAQNVSDHAAKTPLPPGTTIFSYVSIRYYKATARAFDGAFSAYLRRLTETQTLSPDTSWLEIVINDDGNGIAARQTLNPKIYWQSIASEEEAVSEALSHSSVKLRARDARIRGGVAGEGFSRIRNVLRHLRAFASLRSGRCNATFDGSSDREDSFRLQRGQFGFSLGVMPGSAFQVVIPITEPQRRLF
jgi:hypothetical protein